MIQKYGSFDFEDFDVFYEKRKEILTKQISVLLHLF